MRHFFFVLVVFSRPSLQYRCPSTRPRGPILSISSCKSTPQMGISSSVFCWPSSPIGDMKRTVLWGVSKCCLCVARHDILAWIHFQRLFAFFHWRCCTAAKSFSWTLLSCSSCYLISLSQKLFLLLVFQYFCIFSKSSAFGVHSRVIGFQAILVPSLFRKVLDSSTRIRSLLFLIGI